MPGLEERVAALEEAVRFPLRAYIPSWEPLTEAQEAGLRESLAEAAKLGPLPYRVVPPPLSPDEIRQLLRECVTVVKPGETLILRVPLTWAPDEVFRYQRNVNAVHDEGLIPFKVLILGAEELGVAEDASGAA